jgi:hypothetical protein
MLILDRKGRFRRKVLKKIKFNSGGAKFLLTNGKKVKHVESQPSIFLYMWSKVSQLASCENQEAFI